MDRCIFVKYLVGCFINVVWWCLVMVNCFRFCNVDRRFYVIVEYVMFVVYVYYRVIFFVGGSGVCDVE